MVYFSNYLGLKVKFNPLFTNIRAVNLFIIKMMMQSGIRMGGG